MTNTTKTETFRHGDIVRYAGNHYMVEKKTWGALYLSRLGPIVGGACVWTHVNHVEKL